MDTIIVYGIVLGIAAVFLAFYFYGNYRKSLKIKARITSEYGKVPAWPFDERDYESMKRYYRQSPPHSAAIDDITWADLNMDSVFKRVKNTQSSVGDEYTYRFFRRQHNKDLQHFEKAVCAMQSSQEKREKLQYAFYKIGRKTNNGLINRILNPEKFPKIPFALILLVTALDIASIVWAGINIDYGILAIVLSFCAAIILFYYVMQNISAEVETLEMFVQTVSAAKLIAKLDIPELEKETEAVKNNLKVFKNINSLADIIMQSSSVGPNGGGNIMTIFISYFGLYGITYKILVHLFTKYKQQVLQLYETIGYIELCISAASYRDSLDYWCKPSFTEGTQLEFDEIVHPLLKTPVPNSRAIGSKIIITGSNASGKSTFARTLAVNAVLGQLINTCLAKRYAFKRCNVFTSMNLQDDITTGDSFYVAEVKSLKRLMNTAAADDYSMLFMDEIFKGTNMVERVAAASVILKRLAETECFVCLATHDLELSKILDASYENYHFREQITDDDIIFDYKLRSGVTTGSNAIKLLAYCNYEPEIVAQAEEFAEQFRKSGEWARL